MILLSIEGKNAEPFSFAIGPWFLPQCLAVWDALTLMKFDWVTTNCPPRYRSEMQSWSYPPTFEFAPSGGFTVRQFNNVCGFPELVLQQFETVIGSGQPGNMQRLSLHKALFVCLLAFLFGLKVPLLWLTQKGDGSLVARKKVLSSKLRTFSCQSSNFKSGFSPRVEGDMNISLLLSFCQ